MAFLPTNATSVQAFAGALYGLQVGSATMAQVNTDITSFGGLNNALNAYYSSSFGNTATATVAANMVANIGISAANSAAAVSYVTGVLNATAANARGAAVMNILNQLASLSSDATFGADATAWNTKVAAAVAYTGAADAAVGTVIGQTFTLTTALESFTGGAGNDTFNATQTTFQAGDVLTGGAGTDTLALVDTGTAAWTVPVVSNSGIETVSLKNLNQTTAVTGVTETATVNFQSIGANQTLVINGLTVTAGGSGATAADITSALVAHSGSTSNTVGGATVTGTNTAASWTLAQGPTVGSVKYTSAVAGDVTDLAVTGTAQTGIKQTTSYTVTAATTATKAITFTINGNTVTTAAAGADAITASNALANAINAYVGSQVAKADGVSTVTVSSASPLSLGGFSGNGDNTLAVAANGLAPSVQTWTITGATNSYSAQAFSLTYNGVTLTTAAVALGATAATNAQTIGTAIANAINTYAGATIASSTAGVVTVTNTNGVVLANLASASGSVATVSSATLSNSASLVAAVTSTSQGYTAAAPASVTEVNGVTAVTAAGAADTMDASKFADATSIMNDSSTSDVTFTGLLATQAVTIKGNGASTNGATSATWASTVTTPVLNVTGGTTAGAVTLAAATSTSALTINSTSGKVSTTDATGVNTIGAVTATSAGSSTSTLAIHAASSLTTGTLATNSSTITADGAGKVVTLGAITDSNLTTIDASGMTAGGMTVTLLPGITSFKGGAGVDTVTTAATTATGAVIDGGAGSADILDLAATNDVTTTAKAAQYVNFEVVRNSTAGSVDASLFGSTTAVQLNNASASFTNLNATQAGAVTVRTTATGPTLTLRDATGTSDVLTLTASSTTAGVDATAMNVTGVETINFRNSSTAADTLSFATGASSGTANTGLKNVVVTGAKGVTVDLNTNTAGTNTTYGNQVATLLTVDASGLTAQPTGTNTFTLKDTNGGHAIANGLVVTGSAGDDVVSLGGTTGTDTLASGVVATVNAGDGNDAITVSAGQLYTAASGYLAVNGGANGTAGDTLTISDSTAGTLSDNTWAHISGIENLAFSNTGAISLTAGSNFNNAFAAGGVTITDGATTTAAVTIDLSAFTGAARVTNVGTTGVQAISGGSGADRITITSAAAGTGASTVVVNGGAGADTISVTDASAISTDGTIVVTGGTGADRVTLTVGGVANANTVVKLVTAVGDSTVGSADAITGFYMGAAGTRKADTIDFAGSAVKPAAGFSAVAVTGNTLAELNVAVSTAGLISFSGTKATTLTAAQVESIWTTDIAPRLNNLESALWADANASDAQYGNTLVFNYNTAGSSEVILVGVQATALGAAATTANLVGVA